MMRRLRNLITGPNRSAGMTLVEVLTAMIVLGIVLSLVTKALIAALDQQSNVTQQTQAQNTGNTGMELMTRLMRQAVLPSGAASTATIINYADPTTITFTSRLTSTATATTACTVTNCSTSTTLTPVSNYQFALPAGTTSIKWGQASCSSGTCSTPSLTHTLISGVRNAGGSAACTANTTGTGLFRYYWVNDQGTPTELTLQTGQTSLTAQQLAEIQYIEIDIYTATQTGPNAPACDPLQDYVELRN